MKYLNKLFIGALCVLAATTACKKEFLVTAPTTSVSTATTFSTTENVKQAVNGIAYVMCNQHSAYSQGYCGENRIISYYNEWPSQEFRINQYASGWTRVMTGKYHINKTSPYATYAWAYYYEIIGNANSIVAHVDDAEGPDEEKLFYKAQARTYRDYAYMKLLELYSYRWQDTNGGATDGIVMRMDESTGPMPLSSVAECYKLIYEDLDQAIREYDQSGMDREKEKVWLANEAVAYGVYARAALHKQDYAKALEMATKARNGYPLMSNTEYKAGFMKPTSEWMFCAYDDISETKYYWTFGKQFACNGNDARTKKYGAGDIEREFTERMPEEDVRMSLFLTEPKFGGLDLYNGKGTDAKGKSTAHMNMTYGQMQSVEAKAAARAYIDSMTPDGVGDAGDAYQAGYYYINANLKFWVFGLPGISYVPFMRSSEMVLIQAEANYFLGNEAAAQAALVELNTSTGRQPGYTCTKTGDALFQEIVDYRELELWGEGFNWYDIKRWNRDISRKSFEEGGNCHTSTAVTIKADENNKWTWFIPENETQFNPEIPD